MSNALTWLKERTRYSVVVFKELVKTDFQLRYQGSFLGVLWSVLKPLMLFAVMCMVFCAVLEVFGRNSDLCYLAIVRHLPLVFFQ